VNPKNSSMPIEGLLYLYNRPEVHLIAGMPATMIGPDELRFVLANAVLSARGYLAQHHDVALRITPRFKNLFGTGSIHSNGQVEVDKATGAVSLRPFIGPILKPNFIVDVEAANTTPPFNVYHARIRVHVHRSIVRTWLTPDPLTVHFFPTGPQAGGNAVGRFSYRAEFDDGTVGDITELPGVRWSHPLIVGRDGLVSISAAQPGSMLIDAFIGTHSAQAELQRGVDLDGTQPLITGLIQPALRITGAPSAAVGHPQVLFVADGYSHGQLNEFEKHARDMAAAITSDPLLNPFPRAAGAIEFSSAFIPDLASAPGLEGVSIGAEVFMIGDPQPFKTNPIRLVPFAGSIDQLPANTVWGINELIHAVGLPMPTDALSNATRSNEDILNGWTNTLEVDPRLHLSGAALGFPLISLWRSLATRGLADLRNSGIGVVAGALRPDHRAHDTVIRENRLTRIRFDTVLQGPQSGSSAAWVSGASLPGSSDLVCVLCAAPGNPQRTNGWFPGAVSQEAFARSTASTARRYQSEPPATGAIPGPAASSALAHALGQALTLGSERGDALNPPDAALITSAVEPRSNLQAQSAFNWSAPGKPSDGIRWNWHRIREAALVVQPITALTTTEISVQVQAGEAQVFNIGDLVHLRQRRLTFALPELPLLSIPLIIAGINGDILTLEDRSVPFTYARTTTFNQITAVFAPSDVLYAPRAGAPWLAPDPPAGVPPFPYQSLVSDTVKAVIDRVPHAPLTGLPLRRDDSEDQVPILLGAVLPNKMKKRMIRFVGLFSGGAHHHHGVLHATGHCRMRARSGDSARSFCMVCQYQLIDQLEPAQHGALDRAYRKDYP